MAGKTYTVTGPLVIAKNEAGADVYVYKGGTVPDGQSDAWLENNKGLITAGDANKVALEESKASVEASAPASAAADKK